MLDRRTLLALAGATSFGLTRPLRAAPEKPQLQLAVGGKSLLYYLPLTLAEGWATSPRRGWRCRSATSPAGPRASKH